MAEYHDNSKPATGGTISINRQGTFSYFPIEKGEGLKPFWAIFIQEKTDGELRCSLDMKMTGPMGELDE